MQHVDAAVGSLQIAQALRQPGPLGEADPALQQDLMPVTAVEPGKDRRRGTEDLQFGTAERLSDGMLSAWESLGYFEKSHKLAYSELGHAERSRYSELLGPADHERLALVDGLPDRPMLAGRRDHSGR